MAVVNPHAPSLGFSDRATRNRRDNAKYLGLIRAVALAHQHQRSRQQVAVEGKTVTYIEATERRRGRWPNGSVRDVLGTTTDELSPGHPQSAVAPSSTSPPPTGSGSPARELREATGLGDSQLKVHLARLVDLEYVATERAGPSTSYELVAADCDHGTASAYGTDRPGAEGYRPGQNADRPVIGRFGGHRSTGPNPQVNGQQSEDGDLSAGIGRVEADGEKPLSPGKTLPVVARSAGSSAHSRDRTRRARSRRSRTCCRRTRCGRTGMSRRRSQPKRGGRQVFAMGGDPTDPTGFHVMAADWVEWLATHNFSHATLVAALLLA